MGLFPCGYWCSKRCWYMTFERTDGIWTSDIHRDRIPQLCARYWDSFLSQCFSSTIYSMCTSEPFLVILCDTLFRRSKFIYFNLNLLKHRFLYIKHASFSYKILLKLIHFKSRNSGVTWSRFKYFPLHATFAAKLIHFCASYFSFPLHLPHIELE